MPIPDAPAPLVFEWQQTTLHVLRGALVNEQLFGRAGAVDAARAAAVIAGEKLLPTEEDLREAVAARRPVQILGKAHWAAGWLHYLGTPGAEPTYDDELLRTLRDVLTEQAAALVARFGRDRQLRTAGITALLTETIASWAYAQEAPGPRRWNVFRELSLPITPGESTRFGRIDVTAIRPGGPDLVIEIDSTHKPQNVEKLTFARAAGATAVWVRWHGGRVEVPTGIAVIDLVEVTRGLAA